MCWHRDRRIQEGIQDRQPARMPAMRCAGIVTGEYRFFTAGGSWPCWPLSGDIVSVQSGDLRTDWISTSGFGLIQPGHFFGKVAKLQLRRRKISFERSCLGREL